MFKITDSQHEGTHQAYKFPSLSYLEILRFSVFLSISSWVVFINPICYLFIFNKVFFFFRGGEREGEKEELEGGEQSKNVLQSFSLVLQSDMQQDSIKSPDFIFPITCKAQFTKQMVRNTLVIPMQKI